MKLTKFFIIIVFFLSLCAFVITAVLSTLRENEKEKRIALEGVNARLEKSISQLENEKLSLESKMKTLDSQLEDSLKQLEDQKSQLTNTRVQLGQRDQEVKNLNSQITELKHAVKLSENRNRDLESQLDHFENTFRKMKKARSDVKHQTAPEEAGGGKENKGFQIIHAGKTNAAAVTEKKTASETPEVKLTAPAHDQKKPAPAPDIFDKQSSESLQAGRVLLVNQKFNFVIVNMGSHQGLSRGDLFMVLDHGEKVAKVQIEKLYDDYAAAKIVKMIGGRILLKEGNLVTRF